MNAPTKDQVREALAMEWPAMEARHPTLAGLLDRDAVIERATEQLTADPEYRRAMAEADAVGMGSTAATHLVRAFVQDWLARLLF